MPSKKSIISQVTDAGIKKPNTPKFGKTVRAPHCEKRPPLKFIVSDAKDEWTNDESDQEVDPYSKTGQYPMKGMTSEKFSIKETRVRTSLRDKLPPKDHCVGWGYSFTFVDQKYKAFLRPILVRDAILALKYLPRIEREVRACQGDKNVKVAIHRVQHKDLVYFDGVFHKKVSLRVFGKAIRELVQNPL
jgi:hypothetical protein